jgi:hypothetical protein
MIAEICVPTAEGSEDAARFATDAAGIFLRVATVAGGVTGVDEVAADT